MPQTQAAPVRQAEHKNGDNRFKYLDRAIARHQARGDALIEILHTAQELFGYLSRELLVYIAKSLRLPPSRVYGVATFYHFFSLAPKGKHRVTVCMGTACYVKGAGQLQVAAEHLCGCKMGETSEGGKVSIEGARCVGSCGIAPVVVFDDEVSACVTPEQITERVSAWLQEETA